MIDGIRVNYQISDFNAWKRITNIEFSQPVFDSGAIKEKVRPINGIQTRIFTHKALFETYILTVKEVITDTPGKYSVLYYLTIDGSLHKNYCGGRNFTSFGFNKLKQEILHVEKSLHITSEKAIIHNLELGVNIELPFTVIDFLDKKLISFKGKSFNKYPPDHAGRCLGYVCELTQYSLKIYDKGSQFGLSQNLMRFELRFLKMQKLKTLGIRNLSDLKNFEKVKSISPLLQTAWDDILLFDDSIDLRDSCLKVADLTLLDYGKYPKYWTELKKEDKRRFYYLRERLNKLSATKGENIHGKTAELLSKELSSILINCTNLPTGKTSKVYDLTLKIKGKNVQTILPDHSAQANIKSNLNSISEIGYIEPIKRTCLSCGRDISHQKNNSLFCSAKFVGEKEAHKCRNSSSNPKNNFKHKVRKIEKRGLLFDIQPFFIFKRIDNNIR